MKKNFVLKIIGLIIITGLIIFSCSKGSSSNSGYTPPPPPPPPGGGAAQVTMHNMAFAPASLTVTKGAVVKWQNDDGFAHTVTSNDGSTFGSTTIAGGGSFSYTTTVVGTFNYHCTIHGIAMSGILIVNP
ncbi:MAG: plastocyanin/azurin family copper-binding protein [Ferruginibacter sp.]